MEFTEFAKILKPIIGGSYNTHTFTKTLFDSIVTDEGSLQIEDISDSTFKSYYNGKTKVTKISQRVLPHIDPEHFIKYLDGFSEATTQRLCDAFKPYIDGITLYNTADKIAYFFEGILIASASQKRKSAENKIKKTEETTSSERINDKILVSGQEPSDVFGKVTETLADDKDKNNLISTMTAPVTVKQTGDHNLNVTNQSGGKITIIQNSPTTYDNEGKPYTPISPVRFDAQNGILYLGNEQVSIPLELVQPELLTTKELPYVNALCEIYAEKLGKSIDEMTPFTVTSLPNNLQRHFSSQRKAYYKAEYTSHIARETFADGEQQFNVLKEDAFEGIETTYYDEDHKTGYDRLKAVLEKITNTTLSKSAFINIVGLIGNLEKKGICHILVNDDVINSWVNIDE